MTDRPQQKEPNEETPAEPPPLRLVDSDDSTQPVPGETSSIIEAARSSASSPSPTTEETGTTGGFETLLGRLVVRAGLVTSDEVDQCISLADASHEGDQPQTLADLLVAKEYLTSHQLERLHQEFEAQKSSQRIPGYKIRSKLGSGAMATVFLAKQISLDRPVAIKILPKRFSDNAKFIDRFYKEGRAVAKLNHSNIVGAFDVGRAGDHHYLVMEYVDGRTVHDYIVKHKRFNEKSAIQIVKQTAKALEHAHDRGFVHRDIKPKNIMITRKGVVKLADLGLARAIGDEDTAKAEAGRAYGTPYYISPEQIRGEFNIGPAADIYGLGATFYHMVTGRVPFEGKNPSDVMHRHLKSPLQPPDHLNPEISAGCAQVIEMMMSKDEHDRYQSAADLIEDLDLISRGESPHFAHRTLDHLAITEALTSIVETPSSIVQQDPEPSPPTLAESPLFMLTVVLLGVSLFLNAILAAFIMFFGD